jgi:hypothetical protein
LVAPKPLLSAKLLAATEPLPIPTLAFALAPLLAVVLLFKSLDNVATATFLMIALLDPKFLETLALLALHPLKELSLFHPSLLAPPFLQLLALLQHVHSSLLKTSLSLY